MTKKSFLVVVGTLSGAVLVAATSMPWVQQAFLAGTPGQGLALFSTESGSPGLFRVGTGAANHNPSGSVCIGGGSTICGRRVDPGPNAIRDELISRAAAITGDNGETFIVVTTTNIGYFLAYKAEQSGMNGIYDVRLRIASATGVPSTNITVVSDHSHNGPDTIGIWGGVSAEYMKITADAVVNAATQAYVNRRPAQLKVAAVNQNDSPVPGITRLESSYDTPPGLDLARGNPTNEFRMLVADDATSGARILTLVNYAPHATVTNGEQPYRLTGDWAAWMPQEAQALYGGMGLATLGALGGTDWNKSGNSAQKEAEARARLRTLMQTASAQLQLVQGSAVRVESIFIREPLMQPALLLNYKPGLDRNDPGVPSYGFDVRIDRSVLPPFLTGSVVGTYVSAVRIGDVFLSTFPGEPFGELDHALHREGRVQGTQANFLLGGANDFFGYMVKNLETYEQTARTGIFFLGGCPEEDFAKQIGLRDPNEGACADHWTLMVSPTIGSHIVCTLQDAADRLGFQTANRDAECAVLTALDGLAPPLESDSPVAMTSLDARQAAVDQARQLAGQCRDTPAPAQLCDALQDGARQAGIYLGADTAGGGDDGAFTWLRGDLHVHNDHSADGSFSRQGLGQGAPGNVSVSDQILFAESQLLDFLPLTDHRTFDQHYDPLWRSERLLLLTGEEANGSPHAVVVGAIDMINQADNPPGTPVFRKLQQSIWDAHAQGAAWSTAHPDDGEVQSVNADGSIVPNSNAFATGPNLVEIWNRGGLTRPKIAYCENRWNAGYRFGVVGASDNHFKELWPVAGPGQPMTHVRARSRTTQGLLEALRAGHTVVNLNDHAPFVMLTGDFDGDGTFETVGGDERQMTAGQSARLRVTATHGIGAEVRVYRAPGVFAGTPPLHVFQPTLPQQHFDFVVTADRPQDWYRVEVRGPGEVDALDYNRGLDGDPIGALDPDVPNQLRAITSPIFISTGALAKPSSPELPADQGEPDGAAALFGEALDNAFAGFAKIAEAGGQLHAVAEVREADRSLIYYRRRMPDSNFTAPLNLTPVSDHARHPAIAASGNHVWVVWQDDRGSEMPHNPRIMLLHSRDGGLSWDPEQQLSAGLGRAEHADIALIEPGLPVVVWQDNAGGAFDVRARVVGRDLVPINLSAPGKPIIAGFPFDSRSAIHPASVRPKVAVSESGTVAVTWQDNRTDPDPGWTGRMVEPSEIPASLSAQEFIENGTQTDDWEIFVATLTGTSWSPPRNASTLPARADRNVTVAFAGDDLHLAWDSKTINSMAGPRLAIYANHLPATPGAQWSTPVAVAEVPQFSSQRPFFGRRGGELSLLWTDGRSADWRWRVMRATLAGAGTWADAAIVTGPGNATWPSYSNGWLAFTSDRAATREQRKPQRVYLLSLVSEPADTTPNAFSFTNVSGVSQGTLVSSNVVSISGIDAPSPISVTGGEYRINGGVYTTAAGSITNGQTVQVRHTSAATANTVTETTLTIGGVVGKFRSTTTGAGGDTDPAAFGFETQNGVNTSSQIVSNTIMPEGYNTATTVKAGSGTQYSLGCSQDNWTSAQGVISPGETICVRHMSASSPNTLRKTSLQIGKTVGYFSTRTAP